ncbi:MAG: acyloxyacyl hydrolase [Pseudomonadota bacterium]
MTSMNKLRAVFAITALTATSGLSAEAQLVEEVRLGVLQHNICITTCKNADKEDGPNIGGDLVFASPDVLDLILSPRPFITGSVNTAGATSYGGAGLMWGWNFAPGWALEPSFAYVIHDGEVDFPFPIGDPRNGPFNEENVIFGSRDLFRTGLAINRDFGKRWGLQVQYEHLSHGQILGSGRNQGIDNIGLRAYYRFK